MFRPRSVFKERGDDAELKLKPVNEDELNRKYTEFGIKVWMFDKVNDDFQGLDQVLFYLKKNCAPLPQNTFIGGQLNASDF